MACRHGDGVRAGVDRGDVKGFLADVPGVQIHAFADFNEARLRKPVRQLHRAPAWHIGKRRLSVPALRCRRERDVACNALPWPVLSYWLGEHQRFQEASGNKGYLGERAPGLALPK